MRLSAPVPPEAELSLLLSGTNARREASRDRIAELAAIVDEAALFRHLQRQRMLLLILRRLREGTDWRLSPSAQPEIARLDERWRHRGAMFRLASEAVTDWLERAGIPALSLKGAVLAERVHGDEAARVYGDLDVLVLPEQLEDAARRCQTLGYRPPVGGGDGDSLPALHLLLLSDKEVLPPLELHWRVHWYDRQFAADMLSRSGPSQGPRVPQPLDELASLLLFYARDGFAGLRQAADIAAWWDRFGGAVSAGALGDHCRRYPELESAWRAAALACERVVGLPGSWLLGDAYKRPWRREQLAIRLTNWDLAADPDQIAADVTLVDLLCSPPWQRRAFVRRQFVPDADRLREYYDLPAGARWKLGIWRMLHPPKMLARYALALLSRIDSQAWPLRPASRRRSAAESTRRVNLTLVTTYRGNNRRGS
jgi:Uncharacterised nucleotidyltransferase